MIHEKEVIPPPSVFLAEHGARFAAPHPGGVQKSGIQDVASPSFPLA